MKDIIRTKSQFLPSEIPDDESADEVYLLEQEFAHTRRNRNLAAWLAVTGFVFFIVAGTMLLTMYIEKKNMKADFTISEYQDLNLKELLDTSKKYQRQLDRAQKALSELRLKKQAELQRAATPGSRRAISQKYARLIQLQEKQISDIKKSMAKYDLSMRENIRKAEEIVNNYKRLHRLEIQKERQRLIMKYNPIFRSARIRRILRERVQKPLKNGPLLKPWSDVIETEQVMTGTEFSEMHRRVNNQLIVMERLKKIPYRKPVRTAVRSIHALTGSYVSDYERLWSGLAEKVNQKNSTLDSYSYAFDHLIRKRPESGYIIDSRDSSRIRIYISRIHGIRDGDTGYVFRSDDVFIGRISFYSTEDGVRARIIELSKGRKIEPFDRILLKTKNGEQP